MPSHLSGANETVWNMFCCPDDFSTWTVAFVRLAYFPARSQILPSSIEQHEELHICWLREWEGREKRLKESSSGAWSPTTVLSWNKAEFTPALRSLRGDCSGFCILLLHSPADLTPPPPLSPLFSERQLPSTGGNTWVLIPASVPSVSSYFLILCFFHLKWGD